MALVVDESRRGLGIGAALVDAALDWAAGQGFDTLRVRSNVVRERTHAFYERLGFGAENATWRSFYLAGAEELRSGVQPLTISDLGAGMAAALTVEQLFDTLAIRAAHLDRAGGATRRAMTLAGSDWSARV